MSRLTSDNDRGDGADAVDLEYGEQMITPRTVNKNSSVANHEFYQNSVRRQNCCFGISMLTFAGAFVAAYFLMGLSFTPGNIGIFGDESLMKGGSGEVGIDANNAETQAIVDEEVIDEEEKGKWGDYGNKKRPSNMDEWINEVRKHNDKVGKNKWVENKNWWKKNGDHINNDKMNRKKKKNRWHGDEDGSKRDNTKLDLSDLKDKLANHYNFTVGDGKESYPKEFGQMRNRDSDHPSKRKHGKHPRPGSDIFASQEQGNHGKFSKGHKESKNDEDSIEAENDKKATDDVEINVMDEKKKIDNEEVDKEYEDGTSVKNELLNTGEGGEAEANSLEETAISDQWEVIEEVKHDPTSFTQGLSYGNDGALFESTGLKGSSKVRRINPYTFDVDLSVDIPRRFFGEGSTFFIDSDGNKRLIVITWRKQTGFIYDADNLHKLSEFSFQTTPGSNEGWGITYDESNHEFIVSDGSEFLYFWDRDTLQEKRKVEVTRLNGATQTQLNELEFMDGLVCCNIWHWEEIICVDPLTGKSVREYDFSSLWPKENRGSNENVLNGIALGSDHVLVTGKRWDRMFKVKFLDWPGLFSSNFNVGEDNEDHLPSVLESEDFGEVNEEDEG